MNLEELARSVETRADLANFVDALADDLGTNGNEWGHHTLDGFLRVLGGSIRVLDRIYRNEKKAFSEEATWRTFAEMLLAGRIRE